MKSTTSLNKPQNRVEDKELTKGSLAEELEKVSRQKLVDIAKDATTFYGEGGAGIIELQKEPVNNKEDIKKVMKRYIPSINSDDDERESILQSFNRNEASYKTDLYQFNLISDENGNKFLEVLEYDKDLQDAREERENIANDKDTDPKILTYLSRRIGDNDIKLCSNLANNPNSQAEALDNVIKKTKIKNHILTALGHPNISKKSTERVAKNSAEKEIVEYLKNYDTNNEKKKDWCEDIRYNLTQNKKLTTKQNLKANNFWNDFLKTLAIKGNKKVQGGVRKHEKVTNEIIAFIANTTRFSEIIEEIYEAKKDDPYTMQAIAANAAISEEMRKNIKDNCDAKTDEGKEVMYNLASNPKAPEKQLRKRYNIYNSYSDSKGFMARKMCNALATNPSTPSKILNEFAKNKKYWVGNLDLPKGLAVNPSIPEEAALILAKKGNQDILKILTYNNYGEGITQQVLEAIVANKNVGDQTKKEAQARLKALQAQEAAQKQALQTQEANEKLLPQDTQPTIEPTSITTTTNLSDEKPASTEKDLLNQYNTATESTTKTTTNNAPKTQGVAVSSNEKQGDKADTGTKGVGEKPKESEAGKWVRVGTRSNKTGAETAIKKREADGFVAKRDSKDKGIYIRQPNYAQSTPETAPSDTSEAKNGGEKLLENPTVEDVKNCENREYLDRYSKSNDRKIRFAVVKNFNTTGKTIEALCKDEKNKNVLEALRNLTYKMSVYPESIEYKSGYEKLERRANNGEIEKRNPKEEDKQGKEQ